jgi:membrane protease YdiL (CAAX protease family)
LTLTVIPPPSAEPRLSDLVAGFTILVVGLAVLTRRRPVGSIATDPTSLRRALGFATVYVLCASCFARVLSPALLGFERSPWLLALGDVLCVTLGLLAWVVSLAEGRPLREYGFRGAPASRMLVAFVLGLAVVALFSGRHYADLLSGHVTVTGDSLVFAIAFAAIGSALPDEMLLRGYLQGALETRTSRWVRLAIPALLFAALRGMRHLPGQDLTVEEWLRYLLGVAIPLGLWWGFMRDLARGSLWPTLVSNLLLEFGRVLASAPPVPLTPRG